MGSLFSSFSEPVFYLTTVSLKILVITYDPYNQKLKRNVLRDFDLDNRS